MQIAAQFKFAKIRTKLVTPYTMDAYQGILTQIEVRQLEQTAAEVVYVLVYVAVQMSRRACG